MTPLFAEFHSPMLLWGLALAGAPLLIHLLNRRRYNETSWAAMRFLIEAVRKNSRRIRMEQLILLAVRMLILALLVLALAQPSVERLGGYFQTGQPVHKIIVLDASYSMGFRAGESTLFDQAREIARKIVEAAAQGDAINVVRLSNLPPLVVVQNPSFQPADVIGELDQLQLPHGRGDLAACFKKIDELLQLAPHIPRKEVYFLSDFQRSAWTADSAVELGQLRTELKRLDELAALVLIDVGPAAADNRAVVSFAAQEPFATVGRPVRFKAAARNFGGQRGEGLTFDLLVDGKLADQKRIDLNPGAEVVETFSHQFSSGGEHRLEARLQGDALPLDDQRWLALPVVDQIRVLCVNGRSTGRALGRATDFLELALAPDGAQARPAQSLVEPHVVNEGELQSIDLFKYDCVFLCNVGLFTPREAELLETYLRGGGGVVWSLGDHVQPESYNQVLFRDGRGILPARLGQRRGEPQDPKAAFAFDPGDFSHPIVNPFLGNPDAGLSTTRVYAYIVSVPAPGGPARVVLQFDSHDPAIVEMPVGAGRSVLIATSLDDRWGNWAVWPSFVPMMQEIVRFSIAGRWGNRQLQVGEPLTQVFQTGVRDVDVAITRPDGQPRPVQIVHEENTSRFVFDSTDISGIYEAVFAHPISRNELFAVNVDARESDLAKLTRDDLAAGLFAGLDFVYQTQWLTQAAKADFQAVDRGGLTRRMLYAVLYLLFAEQLLAWNFHIGLFALCPVLLAVPLATAAWRHLRRPPARA